jgi:O-succinylbenzoate synthase
VPDIAAALNHHLFNLKKTYEEHQLIAQRYRVEYERTKRRLNELQHMPSVSIGESCSIEELCDT